VLYDPSLYGCRRVTAYTRLNTIDEGSYGVVHRAVCKETNEHVALKRIKLDREMLASGFPVTSLREINILRQLKHPNIVGLKEIVTSGSSRGKPSGIYMVMEYAEHDMKALMQRMGASYQGEDAASTLSGAPATTSSSSSASSSSLQPAAFKPFRIPEIKCLLRQLLEGMAYLHDHWIIHRDLKTSNLLYTNNGILKICDFGLARRYSDPLGYYTPLVVTLWYRAPELLFGTKVYGPPVDVWSIGCIFAELLLNKPLCAGKTEMEQLSKILRVLGTPSEEEWPELSNMEVFKSFSLPKGRPNRLRELFPKQSWTGSNVLSDAGFHLLSSMLTYNPDMRITAHEALKHPYFHEAPLPQSTTMMPTFPPSNERKHEEHHEGPNSGDLKRKKEKEASGFYL